MPLHGPILQLLLFINPPDKTQHRGEKNLFTHKVSVKVAQSCPILCDPMDGSPPGSSVHGILQARILEWVATAFSRGSSDPAIKPKSAALQAGSFASEPPGN